MIRVEQMTSNSGNKVNNQFIIREYDENNNKTVFQSYDSTIAIVDYKTQTISIGLNYDYSTTTGKYRNMFFDDLYLDELATLDGLRKAIKCGEVEANSGIVFKVKMIDMDYIAL